MYYREFTGGMSGLNSKESQVDRLSRQILHWKTLFSGGKDVLILGDSNLCADQWHSDSYQHKELAHMVQDFMLEESCEQMVRGTTRMEVVAGTVHTSTIDHCYTDSSEKVTGPFVEAVGDSDHLGVRILKLSKNEVSKPQIIKRRVCKNFSVGSFLNDIQHSNINNHVTSHDTIDGAAEALRNELF